MKPKTSTFVDRRTILGAAGGIATGPLLSHARREAADDKSIVVEQGGRCIDVTPLTGDESVEEFYDYSYPDRFDGPPGSNGDSFSSEGTTDLQRDRTSILFVYDGPDGRSLVIVHGRVNGEEDAGGTVTFSISGLPDDGSWIVRDDYYLTDDGEQAASNFDRWETAGTDHVIDWVYRDGRTDGGAFRDLGSAFDVRIEPAFNDAARLADEHHFGPVERWEVLSGDRSDPDRISLGLDEPIFVRSGTCDDATERVEQRTDDTPSKELDSDDAESGAVEADEPDSDDATSEEVESDDVESDDTEKRGATTLVVDSDTDDNVRAEGDVVIAADVSVDGNVESGGSVEIGSGAEVDGNVEARTDVQLATDAEVDGNVEAGRDVVVGPDAEVDGNVEAGRDVVVGPDAEVDGNVEARGDVTVDSGGEIDGNVAAGGSLTLEAGVDVDGNVSGGSVDIDDGASIDGNVSETD